MKKGELLLALQYASLCDLKSKEFKVLLYLLPRLIEDGSITVKQTKISFDMDMSKSDVSKAVNSLITNKIVYRPFEDLKKIIKLTTHTYEEVESIINKNRCRINENDEWDD